VRWFGRIRHIGSIRLSPRSAILSSLVLLTITLSRCRAASHEIGDRRDAGIRQFASHDRERFAAVVLTLQRRSTSRARALAHLVRSQLLIHWSGLLYSDNCPRTIESRSVDLRRASCSACSLQWGLPTSLDPTPRERDI
jgi:hypothetical protein